MEILTVENVVQCFCQLIGWGPLHWHHFRRLNVFHKRPKGPRRKLKRRRPKTPPTQQPRNRPTKQTRPPIQSQPIVQITSKFTDNPSLAVKAIDKQTTEDPKGREDGGNTSLAGCEDDIKLCRKSTGSVPLDAAGCKEDISVCGNSTGSVPLDGAGCKDDISLCRNSTGSVPLGGAVCKDDISVCGNSTGSVAVAEVDNSGGLPGDTPSYGEELDTSRLQLCTRQGRGTSDQLVFV